MKSVTMPATVLSVVALLSNGLGCGAQEANPRGDDSETKLIVPWNRTNSSFRSMYAKTRSGLLEDVDPLIILKRDQVVMISNGNRKSAGVIPAKYTFLKSVAHVPLALFVELIDCVEKGITDDTAARLESFEKEVKQARETISRWSLSSESRQRQELIIDRSLQFLRDHLETRAVTELELRRFCRSMAPQVMKNAYDAVTIELGNLDREVRRFRRSLSSEEWNRLYVLVMSGHMPREQERRVLYFQKALGEKRPGNRIVYFEGSSDEDEKQAMELLATHILDRKIAIDFFDKPFRMHRDLLSDAARRYLRKQSFAWTR